MANFNKWMSEKHMTSRWTILKAGLLGAGCGVFIMICFSLTALMQG